MPTSWDRRRGPELGTTETHPSAKSRCATTPVRIVTILVCQVGGAVRSVRPAFTAAITAPLFQLAGAVAALVLGLALRKKRLSSSQGQQVGPRAGTPPRPEITGKVAPKEKALRRGPNLRRRACGSVLPAMGFSEQQLSRRR